MTNDTLTAIRGAAHLTHPNEGEWMIGYLARRARITLDLFHLAKPADGAEAVELNFIAEALADTTEWDIPTVVEIAMTDRDGSPHEWLAAMWRELQGYTRH